MQPFVDFILELDKLKTITRKVKPIGLARYENPAEHTWQIALLAASLADYAARPVDMARVVAMLLVHDVAEIDTGDTMVFVEEGLAERRAAEALAVRRIFGLLPEPRQTEFLALWQEFEDHATAEAAFAHAVDRAMPVLLNLANHGQSWREHGISHARVVGRVGPEVAAGCPALWDYLKARLDDAQRDGWFGMG